jgi:hypothetical protein
MEEAHRLRAEGKISNKEFAERLEEGKREIDQLIAQSRVTVGTKKVIQARALKLFPSLPKKTKPKQKSGKTKKTNEYKLDHRTVLTRIRSLNLAISLSYDPAIYFNSHDCSQKN